MTAPESANVHYSGLTVYAQTRARNTSIKITGTFFWQRVKPVVIVPRYDILKSISHDIYLDQDLNLGQDLGQNLHPPNISWTHDVNKTCLLDVTK